MKLFLCLGQTIRFVFITMLRLHFVFFVMNDMYIEFDGY